MSEQPRNRTVEDAGAEGDVLLEARGVKVHFPIKRGVIFDKTIGHVYAVDGVDLSIRRGETYGLVGESGCGKSTLGRAILKLEPPTDGSVIFDGVDIATLHGEELRRKRQDIQMVFQDPLSSGPAAVGRVAPLRGMKAHGIAKTPRGRPAQRAAPGRRPARPPWRSTPTSSRGPAPAHRHRPGLSVNPKLIVADEPVSALDVSVRPGHQPLKPPGGVRLTTSSSHTTGVVRTSATASGSCTSVPSSRRRRRTTSTPLPAPLPRALMSAVRGRPVIEDSREQILLTGDLPSPSNPPTGAASTPSVPGARDQVLTPRARAARAGPPGHQREPAGGLPLDRADRLGDIVPHAVTPVLPTPATSTRVPTASGPARSPSALTGPHTPRMPSASSAA